MKMLPQSSPKMLSELFEDILRCPRIRGKPEKKFDGHNLNIKFEKLKLVHLSLIFGSGAPFCGVLWSKKVEKREKTRSLDLEIVSQRSRRASLKLFKAILQ